ncbi:MAG: mevalonate kinase [Sandaracinaceae bacterium]|nr:mevalonate kinase [Sandaracinaceae bacterium]
MKGTGRGKAILFGEHAVLYGLPAVAMALERGAEVQVGGDRFFLENMWGRREEAGSLLQEALLALLERRNTHDLLRKRSPVHPSTLGLTARLHLPEGAGLGTSAALGVAILNALDQRDGIARSLEEAQSIVLAWERLFHGNPSGVDIAASLWGGLIHFERKEELARVSPLAPPLPLCFVLIHSGTSASTKAMVEAVASRRAENPSAFEKALLEMREATAHGLRALEAGDLHTLGLILSRFHTLLSAWGLSTPRLDAICEESKRKGALGAKLTGSGGGGCVIALVSDREAGNALVAHFEQLGFWSYVAEVPPPPNPCLIEPKE